MKVIHKLIALFIKPKHKPRNYAAEAEEARQAMMRNTTPETIRVAVDKTYLQNFAHMYE